MMADQLWFRAPWATPPVPPQGPEPRAPRAPAPVAATLRAAAPMQAVIPSVRLWDGTPESSNRKCSPHQRARTINLGKAKKQTKQAAHSRAFWDVDIEALRPKTRADCANVPRPCPWVGCTYHIALSVDIERGSIKETFPQLKIIDQPDGDGLTILEQMGGTCALDIADRADDGSEGLNGLKALYHAASSGIPMGTKAPGLTIAEVASLLNLSIERVRQLGSAALQELRVKFRRHDL